MAAKFTPGPWRSVVDYVAPEGVTVETKIDDHNGCRNEQLLKRIGRLWYTQDGKMYVYYVPTHWRWAVSA